MSIAYTSDVFCDGHELGLDCSEWTHGITLSKPPTKSLTRKRMKDGFKHINGKDYCRICAKFLENMAKPQPSQHTESET